MVPRQKVRSIDSPGIIAVGRQMGNLFYNNVETIMWGNATNHDATDDFDTNERGKTGEFWIQ